MMTDREEILTDALQKILQWSEAYPLDIFPEPDWAYARVLSLDAISASCNRRVVNGIGDIARKALEE